ncbi:MFS transporter [Pectinatus frisingensis]|uniref:MFS transporter n=1 Tax=Pectinatus frisingensis TaxID=865 RepID=UPI0018C695D8|nr:MFS transporter [Pectinatus frisingensis]
MTKHKHNKWIILSIITLASFITNVDATIVIIGLPKLMQDLHLSVDAGLWIITSYAVTSTVFLLPAGKWADMIGKKIIFIGGFTVFTIATILCAIATSGFTIIPFRFLQGAGASMALATATPIIMQTFEKKQLGLAISINATSWVLGAIIGPVIGGALIDTLGWRSIFSLTAPFAIAGSLLAVFFLPGDATLRAKSKMDWRGLFTFSTALTSMLIVLSEGNKWGWTSYSIISLIAITFIGFITFIYVEQNHISPLFNLSLFSNRQYTTGLFITLCYLIGYYSITFLLTIYLQGILQLDALHAGLLLIPLSLPQLILSPIFGSLVDRIGAPTLLFSGLLGQTLGLLILGTLNTKLSMPLLIIALVIISASNSMAWPSLAKTILETINLKEAGIASGMFFTINYASRAVTQTLVLLFMEISVPAALVTTVMSDAAQTHSDLQIFSLVKAVDISFYIFALFMFLAALLTTLLFKTKKRTIIDLQSSR